MTTENEQLVDPRVARRPRRPRTAPGEPSTAPGEPSTAPGEPSTVPGQSGPAKQGTARQRNPRGQGERLRDDIIEAASRLLADPAALATGIPLPGQRGPAKQGTARHGARLTWHGARLTWHGARLARRGARLARRGAWPTGLAGDPRVD